MIHGSRVKSQILSNQMRDSSNKPLIDIDYIMSLVLHSFTLYRRHSCPIIDACRLQERYNLPLRLTSSLPGTWSLGNSFYSINDTDLETSRLSLLVYSNGESTLFTSNRLRVGNRQLVHILRTGTRCLYNFKQFLA